MHLLLFVVSSGKASSQLCPKYALNLNDGGPMYKKGSGLAATNSVYADVRHPSALVLPVGDDLSKDIGEQKDLAAARPEIAEQLKTEFSRWEAKMKEPLWPCRKPGGNWEF